ncbi:MAG: hypothetical protein ACPGVN_00990 [Alphaproteobacteria bacterium]
MIVPIVETNGPCLTIDLSATGLDLSNLSERAELLVPLLYALLAADTQLAACTASERQAVLRGFMAKDLSCQMTIYTAVTQANLLRDIAAGDEHIADHGFPEFSDGQSIDV